MIILRKVEV